ncbi:MAG: Tn3 family transposase [Gammaproteobacteria bacterium]
MPVINITGFIEHIQLNCGGENVGIMVYRNNSKLLSAAEYHEIYAAPILNDAERREYFTFNKDEIAELKRFQSIENAVYFAISLVFFKLKKTFINFSYREVTQERQHVMDRYFPNQRFPRAFLKNDKAVSRIKTKILTLCNYHRCRGAALEKIVLALRKEAPNKPRQRQLCKSLLDLLIKQRVAIPSYSSLQAIVIEQWNIEHQRILRLFRRYSSALDRENISSLLAKASNQHHIISIKQDMKSFTTRELGNELKKHEKLKSLFLLAIEVLPRLNLPTATIHYYANMVQFYNGPRLKQLKPELSQLYLLCYSFTKFQLLNDNLLDAFKKRVNDYVTHGNTYAKEQVLKQFSLIKETRQKVSNMLMAIKEYPHPKYVPRNILYQHVDEEDLIIAAQLLVNEDLDQDILFWKYVDLNKEAIALNIRPLFLTIDFIVTNNPTLQEIVDFVETALLSSKTLDQSLHRSLETWVGKDTLPYLFCQNKLIFHRLEFLLYQRMVHHVSTNKLTLKHSIKHKRIEDDYINDKKWAKEKSKLIKGLGYDKLKKSPRNTLQQKERTLNELYRVVNHSILNDENPDVTIEKDAQGNQSWRLVKVESLPDPNKAFFSHFQPRSIVDVMQFVRHKIPFTHAFESILPKYSKTEYDDELIMGLALANAIRAGKEKMADMSDLPESALQTAEAAYFRTETLLPAIDMINNAAFELPIAKEQYIDGLMHGSLDGMKIESQFRNVKSRRSQKFFGQGAGVSAYNEILNLFSLSGRLIGTNEYEGNFTFEMVHHQNTSEVKPSILSTDKHGCNALNFALFDLTDLTFAPRIPKPHNEIFWGFGSPKDYDGYIVKPSKFIKPERFYQQWDPIQHMIVSLLTGDALPNIIIGKLSSNNYRSDMKTAFTQYNHIVRSEFLLNYIHNPKFRRAIMIALNRGEAYNRLYQAITLLRKGELRGKSEIEMEIWHQCTRLISSIILYYNTHILNTLYENSTSQSEKDFLVKVSPGAWSHINLLGYYQFCGKHNDRVIEKIINQWNWRERVDFG